MKALITGVNGFVGGYLSDLLLAEGVEVYGTKLAWEAVNADLPAAVKVLDVDITIEAQVLEVINTAQPDYIFHLAAQSSVALSWKKPQMTMEVNINGTINILEAVRQTGLKTRLLLIGSSEQYGIIKPQEIPVKETHSLEPSNPYAISKITQELIAQQYVKSYGMDIILVRAFNHIGPRQTPAFVVSDFAKRIAEMEKGKLDPVLMVGNLEAQRDFTDVRDIVRAYVQIMQKGTSGEIYNVGSGKSYRVREVLDILLNLSKVEIKVETDPTRLRPSDMPIIECDNTKLKNITSWSTSYDIRDTLQDVLNYWRTIV